MKTALVTGGSRGIGKAICLCFAERGYRVGALARDERRLDELKSGNANIEPLVCDVTREDSVRKAVGRFLEEHEAVDVLVNNAGFADHKPVAQYTFEDWRKHFDVNVHGTFLPIHFVLPHMLKRGQGHIVNICSMSGKLAHVNGSAYSAAKHAVHALTRALLAEVRGCGVRVTGIYPGTTLTDMLLQNATVANPDAALQPADVAEAVWYAVQAPSRVMVEEINVTPRESVIVNTIR